jgi:hypothetical protein
MSMATAICIKRGVLYYGWALRYRLGHGYSRRGAPLKVLGCEGEVVDREPVDDQKGVPFSTSITK